MNPFVLVLAILLSALIGLSLGLIGGGGSIITVPVLVYVMGVGAHDAIPISLAVVGSTALVGLLMHRREGNVDLRTGALFGGAGIAGALFGSKLTYLVPERTLLLIFGGLMLVVASIMLLRKSPGETKEHAPHPVQAILAGAAIGVLTGFLGVGGGFLIVPALMLFANLGVRRAIGTSLAVILINCIAGIIGHLRFGSLDLGVTLLVAIPAFAGALAGVRLSGKTSTRALRRGFAIFVILVGAFLIVRNWG